MRNYATSVAGRYDSEIAAELIDAGIKAIELPNAFRYGECQTKIYGELLGWKFRRAWYYWVATGPGIPVEDAEQLHAAHGQEVRVDGHCGAPSPRETYGGLGCGLYHVDSAAGLRALANTLREVCAQGDQS